MKNKKEINYNIAIYVRLKNLLLFMVNRYFLLGYSL